MNSIVAPQCETRAAARQQIERKLRARYATELRQAGGWRRLRLELRIQRELGRELNRRFPPHALYAHPFVAW